ncbi:MAG TPA: chromosome segregation protein SMC [Treponema sp.]|nr:chromosome segregation protein SMC [Treponema sp.]
MINSIRLSNFLSFGNDSEEIKLNPLNIVIGTNGSGKSNFLEAFDLLRCAPSDITKPIREGGGVSDWLYKGDNKQSNAAIDVVVKNSLPNPKYNELRYAIEFNAVGQQFEIVDEKIVSKQPDYGETSPYIFYDYVNGRPTLNILDDANGYKSRKLQREDIDITQSILVQKRDAIHYPEITQLAQDFSKIKMYREWNFGRYTPARLPQKADLPNKYLEPDCGNLGLVLNQIRMNPPSKRTLLKELQFFYADVEDYDVSIVSNTAQIVFHERGLNSSVPATRLSDGTLRFLCLLAILCHPSPPPLICIEEPELGLHPDVLPNLAKLLRDASERSQLIVTTHSEMLVDAFTDNPETVLVAEKRDVGTQLNRLDNQQLKPWLEKYRLGQLWTRGDIGGTRW